MKRIIPILFLLLMVFTIVTKDGESFRTNDLVYQSPNHKGNPEDWIRVEILTKSQTDNKKYVLGYRFIPVSNISYIYQTEE